MNDLISKSKLVEEILEEANTKILGLESGVTLGEMKEWVENQPTVESPTWIPCSERLPEIKDGEYCSDCVLVTLKWWDGELSETVGWYNNTGIWNEDGTMCKVIAWMPYEPYRQT